MKRPPSGMTSPRGSRVRAALFALIPLVLLWIAGEIAATVWLPDVRGTTYFQTNLRGLTAYVEDPDLFWKIPGETDERIADVRADRGPRMLLTLGGSIAQGSSPAHFTALLEERYRPRYPDLTVHNLAVAGYTSHQSRAMLAKVAPPARPRVVLLCNAFNDSAAWWNRTDREIAEANRHWSRLLLRALNRSPLFSTIRHAVLGIERRSNQGFAPGDHARVPLDDYRANLEAIAKRTADAGGSLILVSQAMPSRRNAEMVAPYIDVMGRVADTSPGVYLCDVRPRFVAERERLGVPYLEHAGAAPEAGGQFSDALFIDADCHVTDLGYSLMADEIQGVIKANGLLELP